MVGHFYRVLKLSIVSVDIPVHNKPIQSAAKPVPLSPRVRVFPPPFVNVTFTVEDRMIPELPLSCLMLIGVFASFT